MKGRRQSRRRLNKQETAMSNGAPTWNGIPTQAPEGSSLPSNIIFVPEDTPHYYRSPDGVLQVISSPEPPGPPPVQYQDPGYHAAVQGGQINWPEPHALFGGNPESQESLRYPGGY